MLSMILNSFAVLSGFVVVLRGIVALLVIGLACQILRARRRANPTASEPTKVEDRVYLLSLLSAWLLGLSLISWPLLYLLLQSYVPQWPGVMCIFGVTRIGTGSIGLSRFLPGLIASLQCLKPSAIFVSGVWWLLYRMHCGVQANLLMTRVLIAQLLLGLLALTDSVMEAAYLVIPKKEEFLFTGCCTSGFGSSSQTPVTWLSFLSEQLGPMWLSVAYYLANLALIVGLWFFRRLQASGVTISFALLGAVIAIPVTATYMVNIAAPAVLRLPYHHCLYDLVPRAPEMVLAIVLFGAGICCVGWAGAVRCLAHLPDSPKLVDSELDRLLVSAANCFAGSLMMTFLEVHLA